MESSHEGDYQRRVAEVSQTRFLPNSSVEIIHDTVRAAPPRFALFDFDGTLSLIRAGWSEVMLSMMVEELQAVAPSEPAESLSALVREFVANLTGKQTIYQMFRLCEEIERRGGTPDDPLVYKHRYHDRLMERIDGRREALRRGTIAPEAMLVPCSLDLLDALRQHDVELYLASGTDEHYVREEVELLGLDPYFGEHVYGAVDDYKAFSKQMVIERILAEHNVDASRLVGFGDGYVEIDNIKAAGGIAVGVASDEENRSGRPDRWKRDRLIGVGADVIVPDFRDFTTLCNYLWNSHKGRV